MMIGRAFLSLFSILLFSPGCHGPESSQPVPLKYKAVGSTPQVIALYEAWFGHPKHMDVGYSSQDPSEIAKQIREAKARGITAFVVDWYGDREPFIDKSYALVQSVAAKKDFQVAMMYDETDHEDGATDEAIADFTIFRDIYLSQKSPGHQAYLTYQGRPVIFIFPKGGHTDWDKVRAVVNKWTTPPFLIYENLPGLYAGAFDGYYAWVNPGDRGWAPDGSNWGEQYLDNFYRTMKTKYPDKIIVGGAWARFDDSKASWGLNRQISARCGQTYTDTFNFWRKNFPPDDPPPFVMIETWNDHEEGTAIEGGIPSCGKASQTERSNNQPPSPTPAAQGKP
jgi:hypothetical protein